MISQRFWSFYNDSASLEHHRLLVITHLAVFAVLDVLLPVEEPVGDFVLARILHDGHHTLNLKNKHGSFRYHHGAGFTFQVTVKVSIDRFKSGRTPDWRHWTTEASLCSQFERNQVTSRHVEKNTGEYFYSFCAAPKLSKSNIIVLLL